MRSCQRAPGPGSTGVDVLRGNTAGQETEYGGEMALTGNVALDRFMERLGQLNDCTATHFTSTGFTVFTVT